jgi:hypothetical protein
MLKGYYFQSSAGPPIYQVANTKYVRVWSFESASGTLAGIEVIRIIQRHQVLFPLAATYMTFCLLAT